MIKKLYSLALVSLCLFMGGCEDNDESIDPSSSEPVIKFAYDQLEADMNKVDNLPIVAVIQAQAGLRQVTMKIQQADSILEYKTVTEFFNAKSYSLAEKLNYQADYKTFIVNAIDQLGREVSDTLPLSIIGVKEAPQIVFTPEAIVYNEMIGGDMPHTHFEVTSTAGLKHLEIYLVSAQGQEQYGFPIDFNNNETSYVFDELIEYQEGDKGFKVIASDVYDQVKIVTLPVQYITAAPPVITVTSDTVYADKDETKKLSLHIESEAGMTGIKIYRIEGNQEILATPEIRPDNTPNTLDIEPEVTYTNATSRLKIVVTDHAGKSTTKTLTAIVNMQFIGNLHMGSQILTSGYSAYPEVYALLSLKDLKTYSLDYALESREHSANVDLKFYVFGGNAVLRMYSIDGGNGTKSNEFKNSADKSVNDLEVQNKTRLLKLPNFDFDNATAETIAGIPASNITANNVNPFVVGDVIAFKTGDTSSSGGGRIGILKVLSDVQANPSNVTARVITVAIKFPKQ